jgi:Adenylate cyclase, family 3 (some proteins contain HAMP domain)
MALIFFRSPEEPARCAIEISEALKTHPDIQLRMGVHSGPINQVTDVNDRVNVAGTGINVAQRVMDCADAGHILLTKHVADDLAQYRHWQPYLHDWVNTKSNMDSGFTLLTSTKMAWAIRHYPRN